METMNINDVVISYGIDAEEVLSEELYEARTAYVWAREEAEFFPGMEEDEEEGMTDYFWCESLKAIDADDAIRAFPERSMAAILAHLQKQGEAAEPGKTPHFIVLA